MVSQERIQEVVNSIAEQFRPDKIILFGSYAYGTPNEDSDVDLLVVMEAQQRDRRKSIAIRSAVQIEFPCDLLVYDPAYLQQRCGTRDWFIREVMEKGQVLYDGRNAKVGDKGRVSLEYC